MEIKKSDFVQSLEKGLKVINAFSIEHQQMTLTEVSKKVGLTRANARRMLLTLQYLGYVNCTYDRYFSLSPKVLSLGYSYLSSISFRELAIPYMQDLTKEVNESCSMSVLDKNEIVYVARVHTKRIMTISLAVGTRLPVYATSMGKVLLGGLEPVEFNKIIRTLDFVKFTEHTLTKGELIAQLSQIREQHWAVSNEELEIGVRSIAYPVRDKHGKVVAALNISGHASRVSLNDLKKKYLPVLKQKIEQIENALNHL